MGIPPNQDRNDILYDCWSHGDTIEEASEKTGIPKSTVGYFYKKFDRYARKGDPIPKGTQNYDELKLEQEDWELKDRWSLAERVDSLEKEGKFVDARNLILLYEEKRKVRLNSRQMMADSLQIVSHAKEYLLNDKIESSLKAAVWSEEDGLGQSTTNLRSFPTDVKNSLKRNKPYTDDNYRYIVQGDQVNRWRKRRIR